MIDKKITLEHLKFLVQWNKNIKEYCIKRSEMLKQTPCYQKNSSNLTEIDSLPFAFLTEERNHLDLIAKYYNSIEDSPEFRYFWLNNTITGFYDGTNQTYKLSDNIFSRTDIIKIEDLIKSEICRLDINFIEFNLYDNWLKPPHERVIDLSKKDPELYIKIVEDILRNESSKLQNYVNSKIIDLGFLYELKKYLTDSFKSLKSNSTATYQSLILNLDEIITNIKKGAIQNVSEYRCAYSNNELIAKPSEFNSEAEIDKYINIPMYIHYQRSRIIENYKDLMLSHMQADIWKSIDIITYKPEIYMSPIWDFINNSKQKYKELENQKDKYVSPNEKNKRISEGMPVEFADIKAINDVNDVSVFYKVNDKIAILTEIYACIKSNGDELKGFLLTTGPDNNIIYNKVSSISKSNSPTTGNIKLLYYLLGNWKKAKKPNDKTIEEWKKNGGISKINSFFNRQIPLLNRIPVIFPDTCTFNNNWKFTKI